MPFLSDFGIILGSSHDVLSNFGCCLDLSHMVCPFLETSGQRQSRSEALGEFGGQSQNHPTVD